MSRAWIAPTLALLALAACKKGADGTNITSVLAEAPPPTLPTGWTMSPTELPGFQFALPQGWRSRTLSPKELEEFTKMMNESAWGMLGQRKADVNFETAFAIHCMRSASLLDPTQGFALEEQFLVAIKEDLGRVVSLKEAADRWRDTINLEGEQNPPKEATVQLPVGTAVTLTKSNAALGIIEKVTAYILVDDKVQYTFIFNETATKNADPAPTQAIMETFRVKRG